MITIKYIVFSFLLLGLLIISTIPFQSCEPDDEENECDTCSVDKKPNIYIYPTETIQLSITLNFPLGGKIVISAPDYNTGWNVIVDTNGIIDNTYEYLFYESIQPDVWQQSNGWIVEQANLESFFKENLSKYGFYGREIKDFINYWIPRLTDYNLYEIYPQESMIINDVIKLKFSKEPENILRIHYLIKGANGRTNNKMNEPKIDKSFERKGYFVTEWGVILK